MILLYNIRYLESSGIVKIPSVCFLSNLGIAMMGRSRIINSSARNNFPLRSKLYGVAGVNLSIILRNRKPRIVSIIDDLFTNLADHKMLCFAKKQILPIIIY